MCYAIISSNIRRQARFVDYDNCYNWTGIPLMNSVKLNAFSTHYVLVFAKGNEVFQQIALGRSKVGLKRMM